MSYIDISAEKDGDAYLKMLEGVDNDTLTLKSHFPDVQADSHALAELTISSPNGSPITCIVSSRESCIIYNPGKMQISTASPIGKFVSDNRHNLKPGMTLPNGSTILNVAYVNIEE